MLFIQERAEYLQHVSHRLDFKMQHMPFFNEELKRNRNKLPEKIICSFAYYLKLMLDQLLAQTIMPTKGK